MFLAMCNKLRARLTALEKWPFTEYPQICCGVLVYSYSAKAAEGRQLESVGKVFFCKA
jgi:hypothetical protein